MRKRVIIKENIVKFLDRDYKLAGKSRLFNEILKFYFDIPSHLMRILKAGFFFFG